MSAIAVRIAAFLLPLAVAGPAVAAVAQNGAGDVTIYRCTDAQGRVAIGNVPCPGEARQEVRSMVRPVDGEPGPATVAEPAPVVPVRPAAQYVTLPPAQPLYECMRPDGTSYESDSGIGEERWVPAWGGGWPLGGHDGHPGHGRPVAPGRRGGSIRQGSGLSVPPVSNISIPANPPRPDPGTATGPRPRPPHTGGGIWLGGESGRWERDACHALPQAETCARLRDRRDDIRRRFFNAQQRERDTLRVEERGLNARIDADCRT